LLEKVGEGGWGKVLELFLYRFGNILSVGKTKLKKESVFSYCVILFPKKLKQINSKFFLKKLVYKFNCILISIVDNYIQNMTFLCFIIYSPQLFLSTCICHYLDVYVQKKFNRWQLSLLLFCKKKNLNYPFWSKEFSKQPNLKVNFNNIILVKK
jgi:hypothetical protein